MAYLPERAVKVIGSTLQNGLQPAEDFPKGLTFVSRGLTAFGVSRPVTGLVTVNGNSLAWKGWFSGQVRECSDSP
jgi:hypothetical protein